MLGSTRHSCSSRRSCGCEFLRSPLRPPWRNHRLARWSDFRLKDKVRNLLFEKNTGNGAAAPGLINWTSLRCVGRRYQTWVAVCYDSIPVTTVTCAVITWREQTQRMHKNYICLSCRYRGGMILYPNKENLWIEVNVSERRHSPKNPFFPCSRTRRPPFGAALLESRSRTFSQYISSILSCT